jgi:EmrB/QacA subfamily drug resistance transporter
MAVVASGVFMATLDASIVNVSLPTLANELNTSFASVQWVTLAYLLVITGLLLPAGRLAQMYGAKPVFLTGFTIFTLGSLLAGLATSVWLLVAFRVIQGIGGSITQALGPGMVLSTFPKHERGKAIGMILAAVSMGLVSGPVLGGLLLGTLGWPFIFLINVPFGLASIGLGFWVLPPSMQTSPGKFDWSGTTMLLGGIFLVLLGFNRIQIFGLGSPLVITLIVAGCSLIFGFAWWQTRTASPMIQPSIFRNPDFTIAAFSGYLTFAGTSAHVLLLPFYLQRVLQLPIEQVGLIMVTVPALMGVLGTPAGMLADRTSPRAISSIGIFISAIGLALLATVSFDTPPIKTKQVPC